MYTSTPITAFRDTKQHYMLLDGMRGVAALLVLWYHLYECFPIETYPMPHGYLAVDFFFILSGFVIGYAYDDRWAPKAVPTEGAKPLTVWAFFKRRLIRLHPMVVLGVLLGVISFCIQGSINWNGEHIAISVVMLAMLFHMFFIPELPGAATDIRGNNEIFPINGPHWSLFFEYIGNILYALLLRRLSTRCLAWVVTVIGVVYAWFVISDVMGYGCIGYGWSFEGLGVIGGTLRMLFPFSVGLLASRCFKPFKVRGAFWICSILLFLLLSFPTVGTSEATWQNTLYEFACVCFFSVIVVMAASGQTTDKTSTVLCRFMGDISYPLYAIHYPSMYLFYSYIGFPNTFRTPAECTPIMIALFVGNVVLAYVLFRFYDLPVRRWLAKHV